MDVDFGEWEKDSNIREYLKDYILNTKEWINSELTTKIPELCELFLDLEQFKIMDSRLAIFEIFVEDVFGSSYKKFQLSSNLREFFNLILQDINEDVIFFIKRQNGDTDKSCSIANIHTNTLFHFLVNDKELSKKAIDLHIFILNLLDSYELVCDNSWNQYCCETGK